MDWSPAIVTPMVFFGGSAPEEDPALRSSRERCRCSRLSFRPLFLPGCGGAFICSAWSCLGSRARFLLVGKPIEDFPPFCPGAGSACGWGFFFPFQSRTVRTARPLNLRISSDLKEARFSLANLFRRSVQAVLKVTDPGANMAGHAWSKSSPVFLLKSALWSSFVHRASETSAMKASLASWALLLFSCFCKSQPSSFGSQAFGWPGLDEVALAPPPVAEPHAFPPCSAHPSPGPGTDVPDVTVTVEAILI